MYDLFYLYLLFHSQMNAENKSLNLREAESEFEKRLHTKLNINNIKKLSVVYEQ